MQEEEGGIEQTAGQEQKKTRKKRPKIPTVEAVVAQESGKKVVDEKSEENDSEKNLKVNESESSISETVNLDQECALLETVLFLESEPQNIENISKITNYPLDVVEECLSRLKQKYTSPDSGIDLSQIAGGWILTPRKECFDAVKERYGRRNEGRLSKAAIETLAIIAYSQPITRPEIESIRHVNVDTMMRLLLDRKFIKEVGKKDVPGKPVMYGTTKEFLEFFHLQSITELPKLDEKESERFELAR